MSVAASFEDDLAFGRQARPARLGSAAERWLPPSFDPPEVAPEVSEDVAEEAGAEPEAAPDPTLQFDETEVEKLVSRAAMETAEAFADAMLASEQAVMATQLESVLEQLRAASDRIKDCETQTVRTALELAREIARRVVPRAIAEAPVADAVTQLETLLERVQVAGTIRIAIHPNTVASLTTALGPALDQLDPEVNAEIVADPSLPLGSANVSWRDGTAVFDPNPLLEQALSTLADWSAAGAATDLSPDVVAPEAVDDDDE